MDSINTINNQTFDMIHLNVNNFEFTYKTKCQNKKFQQLMIKNVNLHFCSYSYIIILTNLV